ncbi:MAG: hypothetical protein AABM29_10785 [Actinomycetota bacterium]
MTLAACIAVLAILGCLDAFAVDLPPFDLDEEQHLDRLSEGPYVAIVIPALFSGAVLFVASGFALITSTRSELLPWAILALFFAFMGTDELLEFHESLERASGVDWQILYLPLMLVGGACWLRALNRMSQFDTERLLWLGGAAAWIVASMLEFGAHVSEGDVGGGVLPHESLVLEEVLEMTGSSMFLLALFLVCRRIGGRQPA